METMRSLAHERMRLFNYLMKTSWSEHTRGRILQIITFMPRNTPSEIQEAKAVEIMQLVENAETEEAALKAVEHLINNDATKMCRKLCDKIMESGWSRTAQNRLVHIIYSMPGNSTQADLEAKAEEVLALLENITTEEEALKATKHLIK